MTHSTIDLATTRGGSCADVRTGVLADVAHRGVPVDWIDDPDSRVDVVATATQDLKGIVTIRKSFALNRIPVDAVALPLGIDRTDPARGFVRQLAGFGVIGGVSTLAYLMIFSALHNTVGAQIANFLALLVTAIGNTAADRRFTFGIRRRSDRMRRFVLLRRWVFNPYR